MKVSLLDINQVAKEQIDQIEKKCSELKPLVVISCITYNHEAYLRDALDSFVMQKTDFPFVAIVHDDASTDGTADILREYAEKYPDIILPIYEAENQYSKGNDSVGCIMHAARNATSAKYAAMCEGDDYWTDPSKLQKQVDALESHPKCSIALHRVQTIDRDKNKLNWSIPPCGEFIDGIISLEDQIHSEWGKCRWTFHTSSFVYRSELSEKMAEMKKTVFKKFPYGDMPLLLTCLINGNGYFFSDVMGCYRTFSGGYNSTMKANPTLAAEMDRKVAQALIDFDRFTKGKYSKDLKLGAVRYEYWAICNEHDFSFKMIRPKFAPFYLLILYRFAKYRAPWMLNTFRRLKRFIKG